MTPKYRPVQIALHWLIVALVLVQHVTSGAIVRIHEAIAAGNKLASSDLVLHIVHNRSGLIITGLMLVRLAAKMWFRRRNQIDGTQASSKAATLGHIVLYALLIAQGVTGAIASYIWWPISVVHVVLFKIILIVVVGHVVAALWDEFIQKDGTMRRMLPTFVRWPRLSGIMSRLR